MISTLCTNGGGNHAPEHWADATAKVIFNIDTSEPARVIAARKLQLKITEALIHQYRAVIDREKDRLTAFYDACDSLYDVGDYAQAAVTQIQQDAHGSLWDGLIASDAWADAAYDTIGNHLSTAVHIERLLHAQSNPNNVSAQAYKARFQG